MECSTDVVSDRMYPTYEIISASTVLPRPQETARTDDTDYNIIIAFLPTFNQLKEQKLPILRKRPHFIINYHLKMVGAVAHLVHIILDFL